MAKPGVRPRNVVVRADADLPFGDEVLAAGVHRVLLRECAAPTLVVVIIFFISASLATRSLRNNSARRHTSPCYASARPLIDEGDGVHVIKFRERAVRRASMSSYIEFDHVADEKNVSNQLAIEAHRESEQW